VWWRRESRAFLVLNPYCVSCNGWATVVDHITPHRGDPALFRDRANWQAMCARCHNTKTARHDGGFGRARVSARITIGGLS